MGTHIRASAAFTTSTLRGILAGAVPLIVGVVSAGLTMASILLARWATYGRGFDAQDQAVVNVALAGWALTAAAFALAAITTLWRVRNWLRAGLSQPAAAALWTLGATALIILLPMVVAVLFPQHPAPPRPLDPVG